MLVVSDTTPLNYLILIGAQDVLPALYERVLAPKHVLDELRDAGAPAAVRAWIVDHPAWLEPREVDSFALGGLDIGEAAALALALQTKADALLADDWEARVEAAKHGIRVVGTLGVIASAHLAGLLDFEKTVADLRRTSFRAAEHVISDVRDRIRASGN